MTPRQILTLKKKAVEIKPVSNSVLLERWRTAQCIACTLPVLTRGFALCPVCWKAAPRRFRWRIKLVEESLSDAARTADADPSQRWVAFMRWAVSQLSQSKKAPEGEPLASAE